MEVSVISGVSKVVITVGDQERAKAFWTDMMGFELIQDAPYRAERWIEVRSPDRTANLVLELRTAGSDVGPQVPDELPTSNVMFQCVDLKTTHDELTARGVEFPQPPTEMPFGSWSMFSDTEGNRFALTQTPTGMP